MRRAARAALLSVVLAAAGAIPARSAETPSEPPAEKVEPPKVTIEGAYSAYQRGLYFTAASDAKQLAEAGDKTAMTLLGYLFLNGYGVPRNVDQAAAWLRKSADLGDPAAQYAFGQLLETETGVPRDMQKAADYFEKADKAGLPEAAYELGLIYLSGQGRKKDDAKAVRLFRSAAEKGHPESQYGLGTLMIEGTKWIGKAAQAGLPAAQVEYGIRVFNGKGVEKDEETAAAWFAKAAQAGNPVAQNRLARLYFSGRGVDLDPVAGAKWHLLARDGGDSDPWLDGMMASLTKEQMETATREAADFGLNWAR